MAQAQSPSFENPAQSNIWAEIFQEESKESSRASASETILVCGDELNGKKHLIQRLMQKSGNIVVSKHHYALEYNFMRVTIHNDANKTNKVHVTQGKLFSCIFVIY